MRARYNEIDRYCCDWLSNLMDAGLITPGDIDDRSIADVSPDDVRGYDRVHWFAGIGGWDLALNIAGWGEAPVWTGSCPCQPLSSAGQRKGHADKRHLWPSFYTLIAECRPSIVFGEQVASTDGREWLSGLRADLETVGYAIGPPICALRASARRISDNGFIGWPTPRVGGNGTAGIGEKYKYRLEQAAVLASGIALTEYQASAHGVLNLRLARWLQGFPATWDRCAPTVTPSFHKSRQSSSDHSLKQQIETLGLF